MGNGERGVKRTFSQIRRIILLVLVEGQKTTNQIATESGINWKTVENHLTYLIGKALVNEVLKSEYVRIFKLTPQGEEFAKKLFSQKVKIADINSTNKNGEIIFNGEVILK